MRPDQSHAAESCGNCGHARSLHPPWCHDPYVPGTCNFQYDLCSCREFVDPPQNAASAPHECQRCSSDEWTWCDYRGCSECFEPESELCDDRSNPFPNGPTDQSHGANSRDDAA